MASATGSTRMRPQDKSGLKIEDPMVESQGNGPNLTDSTLDSNPPNPIINLLSSLAVLPSAEQAFNTDPLTLSQNGAAFLGILADLQSSIRSLDNPAFACSPQSVLDAQGLPALPASLFKTPLRDRKRIRQVHERESELLNTGLNVKPRLVMVPAVPTELRAEIKAEEAWSSKAQLQTTLDRYHQSKFAQSSESTITFQIEDWKVSSRVGQPITVATQSSMVQNQRRLTVYLKVNMGMPTGLWGYICFGQRKRRYEGRYQNRERGNEISSAKRLKLSSDRDGSPNPDENEEGEAVIATRFHLFSEVETDKGPNDLSDFRWIQEFCVHLNHLELSLPELLHRLPAYTTIMQDSCRLCSSLLKRGVPPVRRAYLPTAKVTHTVEPVLSGGTRNADEDQGMEPKPIDATTVGLRPSGTAVSTASGAEGQWVAFHSACL